MSPSYNASPHSFTAVRDHDQKDMETWDVTVTADGIAYLTEFMLQKGPSTPLRVNLNNHRFHFKNIHERAFFVAGLNVLR